MNFWERILSDVASGPGIPVVDLVIAFFLSFLLGFLVAWTYVGTHKGLSYSKNYTQSLVIVCMVVTMVMAIIGDNIVRAFGLLGALSIIRFRTVIKDTRDTAFLFLAVGSGMATGTGNYKVAILGTIIVIIIIRFLFLIEYGSKRSHDGLLRFRLNVTQGNPGPEDADFEKISTILSAFCKRHYLVSMYQLPSKTQVEYAFQIKLKKNQTTSNLLNRLLEQSGVSDLNILVQESNTEI